MSSSTTKVREFLSEGYDCISAERVCSRGEQEGLDINHREALQELDNLEAESARAREWHPLWVAAMGKLVAAEAEVARPKDGLRHAQEVVGYARSLLAGADATPELTWAVEQYDEWLNEDDNRALLAEDGAAQGCEYHRPLKVNGCRACDALAEDGAEREFTEAEKQAWIDRGLV